MNASPESNRLPSALSLGPVRVQVTDLERSVAYYDAVLGLRALSNEEGTATLSAAGDARPLLIVTERSGARPLAPRSRLGLFHFALLVPARGDLSRLLHRHCTLVDADHAI